MKHFILASLLFATPLALPLGAQDLASKLPANAQLFVQIDDAAQYFDGLESSSLGRIWKDKEVQDFLGPVLPMMDMGLMQARMAMDAEGMPSQLLSTTAWKSMEFGFSVEMKGGATGVSASPVAAIAGVSLEFQSTETAAAIFGLIRDQARPTSSTESLLRWEDSEVTVELTLAEAALQVLLHVGTGAVTGTTLSESSSFLAAKEGSSDAIFAFGDLSSLGEMLDLVQKNMDSFLSLEEASIAKLAFGLMDVFGLDSLGAHSASAGWRNGDSVSHFQVAISSDKDGGLLAKTLSAPPVDRSMLQYIPAKATGFTLGTSSMGMMWQALTGFFEGLEQLIVESGEVAVQEHPLYQWVSGDRKEDLQALLNQFGPLSFSWSVTDASALMGGGSSSGGTFIEVQNPEVARALLADLMSDVERVTGPDSPLMVRVKQVVRREKNEEGKWVTKKGNDYYEMTLGDIPLEGELAALSVVVAQFRPTMGITDDGWLVMSTKSTPVVSAMRKGVQKVENGISSNADVARFLKSVPENVVMMKWADYRPLVGGAMTMAQNVLPMAAQGASELPIDLNRFPGPDVFTGHMRTNETWAWLEGGMYHRKSVGPVGPAEALLPVIGGFVGGVLAFDGLQSGAQSELLLGPEELF
ncbi:MAG: hypothetical protein MK213_02250 [Planctomycetes bacterium]|nr:hypothetical protein [Planctomycetota bacterium]